MSGRDVPFPSIHLRDLRFEPEALDQGLASDVGTAFQDFCFELLRRQRSALKRFPAAGRDGGIDLIQDGDLGREVFECKYIGEDGLPAARSRWRAAAGALTRHLPGKSQSQYSPWWEREPPIDKYTLVISSVLANQNQVDELEREMRQTFHELGADNPHLSHLSDIDVAVVHWPDVLAELDEAPDLTFRWFPTTRPLGLVPIEQPASQSLFSSFLDSSILGYYSRAHHISKHGRLKGGGVESESDLLERLFQTLGLIVTGPGGHGKTRLVHELGLLAQGQGWCVLRVVGAWRQQSLVQLGAMVGNSARVLLLLDYLEMQQSFDDAVNDLIAVNQTYGVEIGYVANCRSSFYPRVAHLPQHEEVPLSPGQESEWFRNFRRSVVEHILEAGGIGVTQQTLEVCRDVPVLAVFLAYLSTTGRTEDLRQLLAEQNFGTWVRRRLAISFPDSDDNRLPMLIAQFPMAEEVALRIASVEVLSTLEKDGWIESQPFSSSEDNRRWSFIHDVLADQLLLTWLAGLGSFADAEVEKLISSALANETLASVLAALQRIRDHPDAEHVSLGTIVRDRLAHNPEAWIAQAPAILGSPLLRPTDAIEILESNQELWETQLSRPSVCRQIGWLARELSSEPASPARSAVLSWLERALAIEETDYLLRSGLVLAPAKTAARAKAWIDAKPTEFSTQFVITAWLGADLPPNSIADNVIAWLAQHGRHARARFVLNSWLIAGGSPKLIEPNVRDWLETNNSLRGARGFLLTTWLKRGGSRETVEGDVISWLEQHCESQQTSFVLGSWIEAAANLDAARPLVERWLKRDIRGPGDRYVYLSWLNRGGSVEVVRDQVEEWLETREGEDGEDDWYLIDLFTRTLPKTAEVVATILGRWRVDPDNRGFGSVLHGWLVSDGPLETVNPLLQSWLDKFGDSYEAGIIYVDLLGREPSAETKDAALRWFVAFPGEVQAGQIAKVLKFEEELDLESLRAILKWCAAFPDNEDALWRLTQLGNNLHRIDANDEVLTAAEAVSHTVLENERLNTLQTTQLTTLFSHLANAGGLRTGIGGERCDATLLNYVRHPSSFEHGSEFLRNAQRPELVRRILSLVLRGWLDREADAPALERLLGWIQQWEEPFRGQALASLAGIAAVYEH